MAVHQMLMMSRQLRRTSLLALLVTPVCVVEGVASPRLVPRTAAAQRVPPLAAFDLGDLSTLLPSFGKQEPKEPLEQSRYGGDPRILIGTHMMGDELDPTRRTWPTGDEGQVNELYGGLDHLQAVLDSAGDGEVVVVKFKREGCPACGATIERIAAAAASNVGRARFYTVDYNQCKAFCKQCQIKVVPCAHLYVGGTLVDALALGPTAYADFAGRLAQLMAALHREDEPEPEAVAAAEVTTEQRQFFRKALRRLLGRE